MLNESVSIVCRTKVELKGNTKYILQLYTQIRCNIKISTWTFTSHSRIEF